MRVRWEEVRWEEVRCEPHSSATAHNKRTGGASALSFQCANSFGVIVFWFFSISTSHAGRLRRPPPAAPAAPAPAAAAPCLPPLPAPSFLGGGGGCFCCFGRNESTMYETVHGRPPTVPSSPHKHAYTHAYTHTSTEGTDLRWCARRAGPGGSACWSPAWLNDGGAVAGWLERVACWMESAWPERAVAVAVAAVPLPLLPERTRRLACGCSGGRGGGWWQARSISFASGDG